MRERIKDLGIRGVPLQGLGCICIALYNICTLYWRKSAVRRELPSEPLEKLLHRHTSTVSQGPFLFIINGEGQLSGWRVRRLLLISVEEKY
jgi:hypothetical protein